MNVMTETERILKKEGLLDSVAKFLNSKKTGVKPTTPTDVKQEVFRAKFKYLGSTKLNLLGEFSSSTEKIKVSCKECNKVYYSSPSNLLKGKGCSSCAPNAQISLEEFNNLISSRNIEVMEFGKMSENLTFKFLIDGHIWKTRGSHVKLGSGCPKCAGNAKYTLKEITQIIEDRDFSLVSYTGVRTASRLRVVHNVCKHSWDISVANLVRGKGCPKCANNNYTIVYLLKDTEEGSFKIGVTASKASLEGRIKSISKESLHLVSFWETSKALQLEGALHKKLDEFRLVNNRVNSGNTEFFNLSHMQNVAKDIDDLVKDCLVEIENKQLKQLEYYLELM